jgi:copper chaperone CopZ
MNMDGGLVEQITLHSMMISGDGDRDRLETTISGIEGVRDVEVDPGEHTIQITYDPTVVNAARLQAAVEQPGLTLDSSASGGPNSSAAPVAGLGGPGIGLGTGSGGTGTVGPGTGNAGYGPVLVPDETKS